MKFLPQPLMSATIFLVWLALNNTIHPAHIVLALIFGLTIPWFTIRLNVVAPKIRAPLTIMVLAIIVLIDIVKSNITVAMLILGPEEKVHPQLIWVPLDVTDRYAKVALAGIITMTPGTLSAEFSDDGKFLLVHALHVTSVEDLIADIKSRYELPLMEIFQS